MNYEHRRKEVKMNNEEMMKDMMDLFANPLFKKNFFDFLLNVQREGIEATRKFWNLSPEKTTNFPNALELYEKMFDIYINLGFVPHAKYEKVLKENEALRQENKFLKDTLGELQSSIFREGGEKLQETWHEIIDKQLDMNREIAKDFYELFKQLKGNGISCEK
jgi:regulator of replication initiation timing